MSRLATLSMRLTETITNNSNPPEGEHRPCGENENGKDCSICINFNGYATRKSVAQGMIDLALLSANASQLKAILTVGYSYQFYTLMLVLIASSMFLQILQAVLISYLSLKCNINKNKCHKRAIICNNIVTTLTTCTLIVNAVISVFDIQDS